MNIASRNMASMSHCCGFVHPLQHRLAEVPLLEAPFRLGTASLAIVLLTSGGSASMERPSGPQPSCDGDYKYRMSNGRIKCPLGPTSKIQ